MLDIVPDPNPNRADSDKMDRRQSPDLPGNILARKPKAQRERFLEGQIPLCGELQKYRRGEGKIVDPAQVEDSINSTTNTLGFIPEIYHKVGCLNYVVFRWNIIGQWAVELLHVEYMHNSESGIVSSLTLTKFIPTSAVIDHADIQAVGRVNT